MLKILTPVLLLISTSAFALDPAYQGFWAPDPASCSQDEKTAFHITPKGTTEPEASCRFTKQTRNGAGWDVRLSCASEGTTSSVNLRWQIMPNGHLRETKDGQTTDY